MDQFFAKLRDALSDRISSDVLDEYIEEWKGWGDVELADLHRRLELRERRPYSEALDAIIGETYPVLGDGFVIPVDYMGNDAAVVQAARTSYGKGTKKVRGDRDLIRYLMRKWHTTPSEMLELKVCVRVPMDCWRQWIRHRTASVNEYSTRYSEAIDLMAKTEPDAWRTQSKSNKQGSAGLLPVEIGEVLTQEEADFHAQARVLYESRLEAGVAREQARKDLPLSNYTIAYWKIDAHNLMHFLRLRVDSHAQGEIRAFATTIAEIFKIWCPLTYEAFEDYRLNTVTFHKHELEFLRGRLSLGDFTNALNAIEKRTIPGLSKREHDELAAKLATIGIDIERREA